GDSEVGGFAVALALFDPASGELAAEHVRGDGSLSGAFAVGGEGVAEGACFAGAVAEGAAFGEKGPEHVFALAVLGGRGGGGDGGAGAESVPLPGEAAADRPREDAGQLLFELRVERAVLAADEADLEGDEPEPAPDRLVVAVDTRTRVRDEDDLEARLELEV